MFKLLVDHPTHAHMTDQQYVVADFLLGVGKSIAEYVTAEHKPDIEHLRKTLKAQYHEQCLLGREGRIEQVTLDLYSSKEEELVAPAIDALAEYLDGTLRNIWVETLALPTSANKDWEYKAHKISDMTILVESHFDNAHVVGLTIPTEHTTTSVFPREQI